jgi:hypothetical protein
MDRIISVQPKGDSILRVLRDRRPMVNEASAMDRQWLVEPTVRRQRSQKSPTARCSASCSAFPIRPDLHRSEPPPLTNATFAQLGISLCETDATGNSLDNELHGNDFANTLRGSVALDGVGANEVALDRVERWLEKQRKSATELGSDYIAFDDQLWSSPFGPNWLAMVIYDRGRFWVEQGLHGRRLRCEPRSLRW